MSLTLCVTTPEGIVLAADSRQTYTNVTGTNRIGSDSAIKIFQVKDRIGITVAGPAFLPDPDNPKGHKIGIGSVVQDFINEKLSKVESVQTVTQKLRDHLETIYKPDERFTEVKSELEKRVKLIGGKLIKIDPVENNAGAIALFTDLEGKPGKAVGLIQPIIVMVAGYDEEKSGKPGLNAYLVYIPGPTDHKRKAGDPNQYGAAWAGQTDVVQRVVLGFDTRMYDLDILQAAMEKLGEQKVKNSLGAMEYVINWGAMTLFDAIDFSKLMIKTTTAIQRFSDGIKMFPGSTPGVGGHIDIAVILPKEGFRWHQKKDLQLNQ